MTRRDLRSDERGSLIIGIAVMAILALLSTGLLARTLSTTADTRQTQDYNAALAAADGGIADATFRIDQNPAATFTGTGALGPATFQYTATRDAANQNLWTVKSRGTVNGVPRTVEVGVYRPVTYPYAIFTQQNLSFNGNGGANIASYHPSAPSVPTGNAIVGSNQAITCNGGGGGDGQDYFTPSGSVSGCPNPNQQPGPNALTEPVAPVDHQGCPADGTFKTSINGQLGKPFLCDRDVTFDGAISITNAPAIVYVAANRTVTMAGAKINRGAGTKGKDFVLLKAGTGAFDVGNGNSAADLNGVIYAPSSNITVNGGKLEIDGSLTLNSLTVNGNPNFSFLYDDSIAEIVTGSWKQQAWREVPSS